jgi:hypothetical protein
MHETKAKSSRVGSQVVVEMLALLIVDEDWDEGGGVELESVLMGTQVVSSSPSSSGSSLSR